jgi:protocatechuate 3,4-dioxygenase beta subunit
MNDRKRTIVGLLLVLTFSSVTWSQTGLTSVHGTVADPSGAVLAGAEVTLENPATGFHATHTTDENGAYQFPQIPPGKYTITATKAGFGGQAKSAELLVSQPATINFSLSVQAVAEKVEVSDIAQTVNTTDAPLETQLTTRRSRRFLWKGATCPTC